MQYDPKHPLVHEIQRKLSRLFAFQNKITFCWIPSHCQITGNELADKQALKASKKQLSPAIEAGLPVVAKDLNSYIAEQGKTWLQNKWDRDCFDKNNIENKLHFLDKNIGERKFPVFATRIDEIKYNRIRLGHTRLTNSHLPGAKEPPSCEFCNEPITVKHIFSSCPLHAEAREIFPTTPQKLSKNVKQRLCRMWPKSCKFSKICWNKWKVNIQPNIKAYNSRTVVQ